LLLAGCAKNRLRQRCICHPAQPDSQFIEILVDEVEHFVVLKFAVTPLSEVIDLVLQQALKEAQCVDDERQMVSPQFAGFALGFFLE
jgi:hypothetical protein